MGTDGIVYVHLPSKLGSLTNAFVSHELKHAFQFETGNLGLRFGNSNKPIVMYDQQDELAAYNRGMLFGGNYMSLKDISLAYPGIPTSSISYSITNWTAEKFQGMANQTLNAFRVRGITYIPK
jgi:hypothetical protein